MAQRANERGESLELTEESWVKTADASPLSLSSSSSSRDPNAPAGARSSFLSRFYANKGACLFVPFMLCEFMYLRTCEGVWNLFDL